MRHPPPLALKLDRRCRPTGPAHFEIPAAAAPAHLRLLDSGLGQTPRSGSIPGGRAVRSVVSGHSRQPAIDLSRLLPL